ncbi:bifunctional lysylphosphatidylglycerol flippase/synthetase MprF [Paenibacillus glycanilyticus]|uniref:bifunctional lysylphosphatidylglycerol flippase/synthetase MprF n=1 Tax=Paenibacillus glycanilyticus TaxID=126569 RepID=UPI00203EB2AE|nr:bifunctional lysylphosphatidylglycerol flippase/synthetase MprF [Paenibacillus glycanilyticus]MCM3626577.1 bifunctional lysylphosphatidylglycerol flippase/synthetase MprF [Paenibacillus glycanilyticus]
MLTRLSRISNRFKPVFKMLLPFVILLFLYTQISGFIKEISPAAALHLLKHLHLIDHVQLAAACFLAVAAMSAYDFILIRWNRARVPRAAVFKISWIANSFNNAMGFAGLTGAGLRVTLYRKWGLQGPAWLRTLVYQSLSGLTGLSILALLLLAGVWNDRSLLAHHLWLYLAVIVIALYVVLFSMLGRLPKLRNMLGLTETEEEASSRKTPVLQMIAASLAEWLLAALSFWLIIHLMHLPVGFREAMSIYVIAAIAGVASFVPSGLGSFDAIVLLAFQHLGLSPDQGLAVLVLYRIFYCFLPWAIGLALATTEWIPGKERWTQTQEQVLKPAIKRWHTVWNWPSQSAVLSDISTWALAALVFISGILLLVSAATPGSWYRMQLLEQFVTPFTMKGSHQLAVLIGLLMLMVSEGIRFRVKRAYFLAMILLLGGTLALILKGFEYEEAIFLLLVCLLLWLSKARFTREESVFTLRKTIGWAGISLFVMLLYLSVGISTNELPPGMLHHAKWHTRYTLKDEELLQEGILALAVSWIVLTVRRIFVPRLPPAPAPGPQDWEKLEKLLEKHPGNFLTHLLYMGDKSFMWTPDHKAVLAYGRMGKLLVALGDPIGDPASIRQLVRQFRDYADRYAATAVFYQVKAEQLPLYHEYGYRFFKLGEEAIVPLDQFQLSGRRKADLRSACNKYERNGFTFDILKPPFSPMLLSELRAVSDEWLDGDKEKGFSLGTYHEAYLELAPVAVLRDNENRVAAFASIMPVYDNNQSISIDLMRHRDGLSGVMDVLFVHLLQWAKAEGYQVFNLGMAPLASVGESVYSYRGEQLARWVFLKGSHFYGFQGIRRFKEKFDPEWQPRYLAFPQNSFFLKLIIQVTRMISRGTGGSR